MSDGEGRNLRMLLLHKLHVVKHVADVVVHGVHVGSHTIAPSVSHYQIKSAKFNFISKNMHLSPLPPPSQIPENPPPRNAERIHINSKMLLSFFCL